MKISYKSHKIAHLVFCVVTDCAKRFDWLCQHSGRVHKMYARVTRRFFPRPHTKRLAVRLHYNLQSVNGRPAIRNLIIKKPWSAVAKKTLNRCTLYVTGVPASSKVTTLCDGRIERKKKDGRVDNVHAVTNARPIL